MKMRYLLAGVAGSALLANVAFAAETTSTTTTIRTDSTTAASYQGDWRASKLVGLKVYNDNNQNVGAIDELLTDKTGTVKGVVIGVGGFLGMGEHLVAVSFDKIKFSDQPIAYTGASNTPATGTGTATTPPSTTTTGSATGTTAPATSTSMASSKPNPWYPDHAVFNATKDELKAMPEFKFAE